MGLPSSKNPQLLKTIASWNLWSTIRSGQTGVVSRNSASEEQYKPPYRMIAEENTNIIISDAKKML